MFLIVRHTSSQRFSFSSNQSRGCNPEIFGRHPSDVLCVPRLVRDVGPLNVPSRLADRVRCRFREGDGQPLACPVGAQKLVPPPWRGAQNAFGRGSSSSCPNQAMMEGFSQASLHRSRDNDRSHGCTFFGERCGHPQKSAASSRNFQEQRNEAAVGFLSHLVSIHRLLRGAA